jgi:hypothetical protein
MVVIREVVVGGMVGGEMVMITGVFDYFEILARFFRVRVWSVEVYFDYTFTINLIINRLINMHLIRV